MEVRSSSTRHGTVAPASPEVTRGLKLIAHRGGPDLRSGVAACWCAPVDLLTELASDVSTQVREQVATNPTTPVEPLRALARHPGWSVPAAVAGNPSAPPEVLEDLAQFNSVVVRTAVAGNPETPVEVQALLALDDDESVRKAVRPSRRNARRPRRPPNLNTPITPSMVSATVTPYVSAWADFGWLPTSSDLAALMVLEMEMIPFAHALVRDPRLPAMTVGVAALCDFDQGAQQPPAQRHIQRLITRRQVSAILADPQDAVPALRTISGALAGPSTVDSALNSPDPCIRLGVAANTLVGARLVSLLEDDDSDVQRLAARRVEMAL